MSKKKDDDNQYIAEIKHFTSRSKRGAKDIVIEKVRPGSSSARFLERMEARRKARPCNEVIDMRGHASGAIRFYLHKGMGHYFDDTAYKKFREGLARNNGVFTIGTFEEITGGHPVERRTPPDSAPIKPTRKKKEQPDSTTPSVPIHTLQPPLPDETLLPAAVLSPLDDEYHHRHNPKIITFGYYHKRREPRLIYSTAVALRFGTQEVTGSTKDISMSGMQVIVKPSDWPGTTSDDGIVMVTFPNCKGKNERSFEPTPFRIHRIESNYEVINLTLLRHQKEANAPLTEFFQSLINSQGDQYKFDPEDEINTGTALLYEQIFSQMLTGIPVFFRINEQGRPTAHTLGITRNNQALCQFFETANSEFDLELLREPNRVSHICYKLAAEALSYDRNHPGDTPFGEATLIVFKNNAGKVFSVADFELFESEAFIPVLRYAFSHKECLILKLQATLLRDIDHSKMARAAEGLSRKDSSTAKSLQDTVRSVFALAYLTNITDTIRNFLRDIVNEDSIREFELSNVKAWSNSRWHPLAGILATPSTNAAEDRLPPLSAVRFGSFPRRREDRYLARTKAEIEIGLRRYPATTRDISTRGLSVFVDEAVFPSLGQEVTVGLVSFGKKTYNFDLRNIPYRVVGVIRGTPTRIRLERVKTSYWDDITDFFQEIIEINRDKLILCLDDSVTSTQARLHEDVLAAHLLVTPFFIENTTGAGNRISRIGVSEHSAELADYFYTDDGVLDYRGLTKQAVIRDIVAKSTHTEAFMATTSSTLELYCFKMPAADGKGTLFETATSLELAKLHQKLEFIHTGMTTGTFRAFAIQSQRIHNIDPYMRDSIIDNLRQIARDRALQLEQEINNLVVYGEIADITREVLRIVEFARQQ